MVAGVVGGLLGLGGGFIMGPLFLELGVPPQVEFLLSLQYTIFVFCSVFLIDMHPNVCILRLLYCSIWKLCVQVSSATATFAMMFSSSMSVVEYYLLKRFPVPYGKCYLSPRPSCLCRISLLILFNFLSPLLCCCCNYCCFYRATRCSEVDYSFGSCFVDNIHSGIHNLCQCNITWWEQQDVVFISRMFFNLSKYCVSFL